MTNSTPDIENSMRILSLVSSRLEELKVSHVKEKLEILLDYRRDLLEWNEKINLTAIKDPAAFEKDHYIDSLSICDFPEFQKAESIVDVGTGGGFPGIPLAVAYPEKDYLLVDSLNKRITVIDQLCFAIGIFNVETIHSRAEELAQDKEYRGKFDLCVSRAVASLPVLCEYCLPLVKTGGTLIAYKGKTGREELENSKRAIELLGGKLDRVQEETTGYGQRMLIVIHKVKKTPAKYPRKGGKVAKNPL